MTPEQRDILFGKIQNAISEITSEFDTIQIFCTNNEGGSIGTTTFQTGTGNWYARYGQVKAWIKEEEKSFGEYSEK